MFAVLCALAVLTCLMPSGAFAQAAADRDQPPLAEQSLPLRTALHHDPTLDAPLQALVKLYRHQNKLDELLALYAQHLQQWPQDISARTVHLRLLLNVSDPTSLAASRAAVQAQPEHAYFRYLLYLSLTANGEEGALDELHQAIEKSKQPQLQRDWIDLYLPLANAQGRTEQVTQHLKTLADLAGNDPMARLQVAKKMMSFGHPQLAIKTLEAAEKLDMPAEASVELSMLTAQALAELDKTQEAAARLDALLGKVSTDYWRRPEIVRQRLGLVDTDAEREKMIAIAKKRVVDSPGDVSAVISLADLLIGFERYRSALEQLQEASEQMPDARVLEQATLTLLDRMRDETARAEFLEKRLKREPARRDLRGKLARSFYLLGRDKEALAQVELAIKGQAEADQFEQLLQTARFLRESALVEASVSLFERSAELRPARLDVKRELAEVYIALEMRDEVRGLFAKSNDSEAAIENVLDLADFLIKKEFLAEAKALIEPGIKQIPTHLELRLLMLRIHGDTAAAVEGNALIEQTRELTDTAARYHRWLEASVDFHDNFDTVATFLDAEGKRLSEPPAEWSPEAVQRRLAYVELASSSREKKAARALLTSILNQSPPDAIDKRFRRELLSLLDTDRDRAELQQILAELVVQDEAFRDEANAQMALLHFKQNRTDLAMPLLNNIDFAKIRDIALLRGLLDFTKRIGYHNRTLALMERMVELNPTSRSLWEDWLQMLAFRGDESRFRVAVRKLSMGIEKMPLDSETKHRLRAHLLSSYWRSIGDLEQRGTPDAWNQALGLLASAQQVVHEERELAWIVWMRASMLNRLGRDAARDEALFELDRIVQQNAGHEQGGDESTASTDASQKDPCIVFPDGLQVSLSEARRVLTEEVVNGLMPEDRQGPVPASGKVKQRWVFELTEANIVAVYRGVDDQVVVVDELGGLWGVHEKSGKLVWHQPELLPAYMSNGRGVGLQAVNPKPIRVSNDRLVATDGQEVYCVSLRDRKLLWRSPLHVASSSQQGMNAPADLIIDGSQAVVFSALGERLMWFDLGTGKLISTLELSPQTEGESSQPGSPTRASTARLSRKGDRLLVVGSSITIVQLNERRVAWRFVPQSATQFPVKLVAPKTEEEKQTAQSPPTPVLFQPAPQIGYSSWQHSSSGSIQIQNPHAAQAIFSSRSSFSRAPVPLQYIDFSKVQGMPHLSQQPGAYVLSSPVFAWLNQVSRSQECEVELHDDHILLMSSGATIAWSYRNPLGAKSVNTYGTLLGVSGKQTIYLQSNQIQRFNTESQATATATIQQLGPLHDGCLDGPVTYVAGRDGVAALNTVTGKRLWLYNWSQAQEDQPPATPANASLAQLAQPAHYFPSAMSMQNPQGQGKLRPLVAKPIDGTLYISRSPNELVAIEGVDG